MRDLRSVDSNARSSTHFGSNREAFERTTPPFVNAFDAHFSDMLAEEDLADFVRMMRGFIGEEAPRIA